MTGMEAAIKALDEEWGLPNSPKRELLAHALVVEMKNKGGCKVGDMGQKQRELCATSARAIGLLAQLVKGW